MVDQIQEQTSAADHVEALRHRVERVSWGWVIPAGLVLAFAMIIAAVAVSFVVFMGAQSNSAASTATAEETTLAPSRAPGPEMQVVEPISAKIPIEAGDWNRVWDFQKNPDQREGFLSSAEWDALNRRIFEVLQPETPYLYPATPEHWYTGGLSNIVAHGDTWVIIWEDMTCIKNCVPGSLSMHRGAARILYSTDEGKTLHELTPPSEYGSNSDPSKHLQLLGIRGVEGVTVFDEGEQSRIEIAATIGGSIRNVGGYYQRFVPS